MNAVQHIAFNCRDHRQQAAFYTKHFGFKQARLFCAGEPHEFIMLRLGACCLEFFTAPPEKRPETGGEQAIGFKHLAFEVPSLEAAIASLQADGLTTDPIIDVGSTVPGLRICFFRDPEGNILELMQGWQDE
jgi:glyoxylase I family protein